MFAACSDGGSAPPSSQIEQTPVDFEPAPAQMRRLLSRQYKSSVRLLLGDAAAAAADPPPDTQLNGFTSIAASQFAMTDTLVREYELSARAVAAAAVGDGVTMDELVDCQPAGIDDQACFRSFIERFGRMAYRRPLVEEEIADYLELAGLAAEQLGDFYAGIQYVISAMLQTPSFLFQVEVGEPAGAGKRRLTGLEMAARMSFFLTDATPSEALLDAAEAGELDTAEGVRRWARELVAQPAAQDAVGAFFDEYLVLADLPQVPKDPALFPEWSSELARSMRHETLWLVDDVVFQRNAPIHELLTATYTFVDERLADHYGVTPPSDDAEWTRWALPAHEGRAGILSHASILSRQAHANSTSATYRGLFVMERFLCRTMPPPPNDVVTELPPSSEAPTLRDRIAVHQEDEVCRSCHYMSDNIGLSLENFDAVGKWRDKENDAVIDAAVSIDGIGSFEGVAELGQMLAERPDVMRCIVRQVYRHATGHVETDGERKALEALDASFEAAGHRLKPFLVELVASDLFRTVGVGS